ncbi:MAG: right-handed parallel beta-helix repeat-containing protein [Candidatus Margulisiibacteriota bacterium]
MNAKLKGSGIIKLSLFFLFCLFFLHGAGHAATYYVDDDGSNITGTGTSAATAWQTITYALTQTGLLDVISVAAGTYSSTMTGSDESFPITLDLNRTIVGAGAGLTTVEGISSTRVFTAYASTTIESVCVKVVANQIGIQVYASNVNIKNCTIYEDDGDALNEGTGIYFNGHTGSDSTGGRVSTCEIYNLDKGVHLYQSTSTSNATIEYCTIYDNDMNNILADVWGSPLTIYGNVIRGCPGGPGSYYGGIGVYAMNADNDPVTIEHNTIVDNKIGIYAQSITGTLTVKNNIIVGRPGPDQMPTNTSGTYGLYGSATGEFSNTYNNIWNCWQYYYNASESGDEIHSFPHFQDPWNDDYDLYSGSPCLGAADDSSNIGAYDGAGESTGSPYTYRATSYVDPAGGDLDSKGAAAGADAYATVDFANMFTYGKINVAAGTYSTAETIEFCEDKEIQGAGANLSTLECTSATAGTAALKVWTNATVESVTVKIAIDGYGIAAYGSNTDINNCKIYNGSATKAGEGIYFVGTTGYQVGGTISTCEVYDLDEGIHLYHTTSTTNATIEYCTIYDNDNQNIFLDSWGSLATIYRNKIWGCPATGSYQGGISLYAVSGNTNIDRNTIVNNKNGVRAQSVTGTLTLKNNIIVGRPAPDQRPVKTENYAVYGVYDVNNSGQFTNSYNNIWNSYRNYYDVTAAGTEISSFPHFQDPWNNDYDLYAGSPCLGAGEGGVNIGAYEGTGEATGSPYTFRATSYVDPAGGDVDSKGGATGANAYATADFANMFTYGTMNIAAGTYSTTETIEFCQDKEIDGAGANSTTLECTTGSGVALKIWTNATVEGVTVKIKGEGYGIQAYGSSTDINNCKVYEDDGDSVNEGTGIYFSGNNGYEVGGTISTCEVYNLDEGIYLYYSTSTTNATIEYCTIHGNDTQNIFLSSWGSATTILKNEIRDCPSSGSYPGGISLYSVSSATTIDRNTIVNNLIGVRAQSVTGSLTVKNNIISNKPEGSADAGSYGLYGLSAGQFTTSYNNVYNNNTDYEQALPGTGTITQEAQFIDVSGDNFHLSFNSPCIDSGDPATATDPDGSRADMGAYPFDLSVSGTIAVYVKTPNGGESLTGLDSYAITWYATKEGGAALTINLAYSVDSGTTHTQFESGQTNDGSYTWAVTNIGTTAARIQVSAIGSAATDESDSDFSITSVDATGPTVTVEAPAGGEKWKGGSSQNITFTSTDESGILDPSLSIWYSTDSGVTYPNSITSNSAVTSPYPWTMPLINTNQARVKVTLKDASAQQNAGTGESAADFIIDSTAPSAPTLVTPADASATNDTTPELTWEASTDNLSAIASYEISIDGTLATQAATTSYTPPAALTQAVHTWKVKAKDGAGNWGSYSTAFTFEVDTAAPDVTNLTLRDITTLSTLYAKAQSVSVEVTLVSNGISEMIISEVAGFAGASWASYANPTTFTVSVGDGSKTVYYKVRDAAQNESSTLEATITLDTTVPSAPTLGSPTNGATTSDNTPLFTWTASTDNLSGIASYEIKLDSELITQDATAAPSYQRPAVTPLAESSHTWQVKAKDGAGNWGAYSTAFTFEVDTVGPNLTSIEVTNQSTGSPSYTNNQTVSVEAFNVSGSPTDMLLSQDSNFTGASWLSYENPTTYVLSAVDGTKEVYYKLQDVVLNQSSTVSADIILDTTAPEAPTLVSPANGGTTGDSTPTLTWNAVTSDLAGIENYEIYLDGALVTQAATSYTTPAALADGSHTWKVKAEDYAQNWGNYSAEWSFTVDTGIPNVGSITLSDQTSLSTTYTNNLTVSLAASGVTGNPAQMMISESAAFAGASWGSYANPTTFGLSSGDGEKTAYYKIRDTASNESAAVSDSITLDTTAPSTPGSLSPAEGDTVTDATPTFSWSAATDAGSGIDGYEVVISNGSTIVATVSTTSYTPTTDLDSGAYTWQVRAIDNAENFSAAASASFTVSAGVFQVKSITYTKIAPTGIGLTAAAIINFTAAANETSVEDTLTVTSDAIAAVTVTATWSSGSETLYITPASGEWAQGTKYYLGMGTGAQSAGGIPLSEVFAVTFTTQSGPMDSNAPTITIKVEGATIVSDQYLSSKLPTFQVTMTDDVALDSDTLVVKLDNSNVSPTITSSSNTEIKCEYTPGTDLEDEDVKSHTIEVTIKDTGGNSTTKTVQGLKVLPEGQAAAIVEGGIVTALNPVTQQPVFSPTSNETMVITYDLNTNANTGVLIMGPTGGIVWNRRFPAGGTGGKAGPNQVTFNGISDITSVPLGAGIYVGWVTVDGKVQPKSKFYTVISP